MYIDPNTGGMLFQALAVLFGVFSTLILFFSGKIRMYFARLKRLLRSSSRQAEQEQSTQPGDFTSAD